MHAYERPGALAAALGDGLALAAFVLVGAGQHGEGFAPGALVRTGLPLLAAWAAVAAAVGTYRRVGWATLAMTWVVAVPLGLVARSVIRGGPWGRGLLIFGGVAMGFTLLFLVAGRLALLGLGALRARRAGTGP